MQEQLIETSIPETLNTLNLLISHYKNQLSGFETFSDANIRERIKQKVYHLEIAREAVEKLQPMKLVENKCPVCEYDFAGVYAFYCPKCGQAISDFIDIGLEE